MPALSIEDNVVFSGMLTFMHPFLIRCCHWINVQLLLLMIWSGILIYWAHPAYGDLPETLTESFHLHHRLAEGMGWHFLIMWPLVINGSIYLLYLLFSGAWKRIIPNSDDVKYLIPYILKDLHLSKRNIPVLGQYNPAQKMAYTSAILMGIMSVISGLAIYKPVQLGWLSFIMGGYTSARLIHFLCMAGLVVFIFIHILQVIRAGWWNFYSMISGEAREKN